MNLVFKDNKFFLIPFAIFLIAGGAFLITHTKTETHLIINHYHNSFLDTIMPYLTWLGDGWAGVILVVILLFVKLRFAIFACIAFLIESFLLQFSRRTIFHGMPRPATYFKGNPEIHWVPGVSFDYWNSFPSGHTACAFTIYFCLSILVKNNWLKFFFFFLALLTAFTRVYLSQHFFMDVYGGSILGVISALIAFFFVNTIKKNWAGQPIQKLFKRS